MWLWFEMYSKPNLRLSSVEHYTNYIRWHIELNIGRIKLKQLTPLQIQQFYNRTKESGRVKRWEGMDDLSLSNRVVRGIHMVLNQALQQAVELQVEDRKNHSDSLYLFPSPRTGGMWSPDAIGRLHKALLRAAGIDEGVRFHDLRHPNVKPKTKDFYPLFE